MSKIFKVRNRIIDVVETNGNFNNTAYQEIEKTLSDAGYTATLDKSSFTDACSRFTLAERNKDSNTRLVNAGYTWNAHTYCIYELGS